MGTRKTINRPEARSRSVPLATIVKNFWNDVHGRLISRHNLDALPAAKGVRIYRRRVGAVALNRGVADTASNIAAAVRSGRFRGVNSTPSAAAARKKTQHSHSIGI